MRRSVSIDKTRGWYLGGTWITRQTALLNCAKVGRIGMLAERAFQCQRAEGLTDSRRTDGRTDRTGRLTDRRMDERMGIWKDRHASRLVEMGTL